MVLHSKGRGIPLREYGILIPVAPDRVGQVLDALTSDPDLGPRVSQWLIQPDGSEITRDDLLRVHSKEYVERALGSGAEEAVTRAFELVDEHGNFHRYDPSLATRPLTELTDNALRWMAGSYQVGKEALAHGFCFNLGGGGHHGHRDFGHGFCIFNDIVTGVRKLQAEGRITTAWIIDIDAHKGDGTAALTAGDDSIITLSIHMARGWPLDLPRRLPDGSEHPSYTPSDIDVPVDSGEEASYVSRLEEALSRLDRYPKPDIAYVVDGADPYEYDGLPSTQVLRLTMEQMNARDNLVYRFLNSRSIPAAFLMAGGYGPRAWEPYPAFLIPVLKERLGI